MPEEVKGVADLDKGENREDWIKWAIEFVRRGIEPELQRGYGAAETAGHGYFTRRKNHAEKTVQAGGSVLLSSHL